VNKLAGKRGKNFFFEISEKFSNCFNVFVFYLNNSNGLKIIDLFDICFA
jgi:hypothetical protein